MVKITELKVHISCQKCKKKLIQSISSLEGIDKVEVDAGKSRVTVIGDADPIAVITQARKAAKYAEVLNIGSPAPPKEGEEPDDKKEPPKEDKEPDDKTEQRKEDPPLSPPPLPPPVTVIHVPSTYETHHQAGLYDADMCSIL